MKNVSGIAFLVSGILRIVQMAWKRTSASSQQLGA